MPVLDVSDQSLAALAPDVIAADPLGPCRIWRWLPGLGVAEVSDRGAQGRLWRAWAVTGDLRWQGTAEVYLEPWHDSTVIHLYVRLDPCDGREVDVRVLRHWRQQLVVRWNDRLGQWRDLRTTGREPGTAALKVGSGPADG